MEAGACGAAAPLRGVGGIEGSVGVVMLSDAVPERVGPRVVEAAREVSDALR
jgi:DNA-binding IclR family transcriptional regulator